MERAEIINYYAHDIEVDRLELPYFKLEGIRTKEIIERYLHKSNLEIVDVGGATGYYAFWLQQKGHQVTLVDLTPRNIELAKKHSEANGIALNKMEQGDATNLNFPAETFDMVLMLGPLYHLTDRQQRVKALSEARRVLKPGGILIAAVISRYASVFDGFQRDLVFDDRFFSLVKDDLQTGVHRNETDNLEYFTTAYLHTPAEIKSEVSESSLQFEKLLAVESFGWIVKNIKEKVNDPVYMEKLLTTIRSLEEKEDLMAMSQHILAIAKK